MKNAYSNCARTVRFMFLLGVVLGLGGAFVPLAATTLNLPVTALVAWYAGLAAFLVLVGIGVILLVSAAMHALELRSSSPQDVV